MQTSAVLLMRIRKPNVCRLRTEYARDLFTHYYYPDPFEVADCA